MLFAAVAQTRPAGAPEIRLIRWPGAAVPAAKPVVQSTCLGFGPVPTVDMYSDIVTAADEGRNYHFLSLFEVPL